MIDKKIFNNLTVDYSKLKSFGFIKNNNKYVYRQDILNGEFEAVFTILNGEVAVDVIEKALNDNLALFYIPDASGSFIGSINDACQSIANKIADECFYMDVFKFEQSKEVINYVKNTYGINLEYLWKKFPYNAIWRNQTNKKWFGLMVTITKDKLGISSKQKTEAIVMRCDPKKINSVVDNKIVFAGYHMNKKSWITLCLDNSASFDLIKKLLDESYLLAR